MWDPGWALRPDFFPAWYFGSTRLFPSHHPCYRITVPHPSWQLAVPRKERRVRNCGLLLGFFRNANTGAFRLECHHGLEPTAKYFFVPNICVLQPNVFSLGTVHPGKGWAHAMTMSRELGFNELCCWFTLDLQNSCVPAPCLDHPLVLELLRALSGTGE